VNHDIVEAKIWEILTEDLNLDRDGVMMLPLKASEIEALGRSIRDLVNEAVAEAHR
jgi:hypothetical protein